MSLKGIPKAEIRAMALTTAPIDRAAATAAAKALYAHAHLKEPEVIFVDDPSGFDQYRDKMVVNLAWRFYHPRYYTYPLWSGLSASTSIVYGRGKIDGSFALLHGRMLNQRPTKLSRLWVDFLRHSGPSALHSGLAVISERPVEYHLDADDNLSNRAGPAVRWANGYEIYAVGGIPIGIANQWMIRDPDSITKSRLLEIRNAEIRRIAMEIAGPERLAGLGGRIESTDKDINRFKRQLISFDASDPHNYAWGDEEGILVEDGEIQAEARILNVINGSLEPDGSRREFYLGAMPDASTPHEAVAMSYGIRPEFFKEAVRT